MDENSLKRPLGTRRIVHHALELWSPVIRGGSTRFLVFSDDDVLFFPAPSGELVALVGDGEVLLGLAGRGDP